MQTAKQITSKFLSLQGRDFIKGLLIAVIVPVIATLYSVVKHWIDTDDPFVIDWKEVARAAFYAFTAYISKNFFEPTQTVIVTTPPLEKESGEKKIVIDDKTQAGTE